MTSLPRYRTGKDPLDGAIMDLIDQAGLTNCNDLSFEMIVSVL